MNRAKRLARIFVYPSYVAAGTFGAVIALEQDWPLLATLALGTALFTAIVIALERWLPYAPQWQRSRGDLPTDIIHLVVIAGLIDPIPAFVPSEPFLGGVWPVTWPMAAQVLLALVVHDALNYATHRLLHGPLWRFHAIHHSAPRLYWVNSWRMHPVEGIAYALFTAIPLVVLGAPPYAMLVAWVFASLHRMLQHSNVDLRVGPLNWVFASAELHRWHHSRDPREHERNYGNVFIVWDSIFGTRYFPKRAPPLDVGIDAPARFPTTYAAQVASPFRARLWRRGAT